MISQEKPIDSLHPETQSETPSQLRRAKIRYLLTYIGACWSPTLALLVTVLLMKGTFPGAWWLLWAGSGTGVVTVLGFVLVLFLDPARRNTFVTVVYAVAALAILTAVSIMLFAAHWSFCDAHGVCHSPYPRPM
jgi:integral membrane sensor domain MASE1